MKRTITLLITLILTTTSIFAASANINLKNTIEETSVVYKLFYNNDMIDNEEKSYEINILQPLTEGGNTNPFLIYASSNMNKDLSINVNVVPDSFKTTINNKSKIINSNITPTVFSPLTYDTLSAGKHENEIVYVFILSWDGNKDLVAGDYVSNVNIEYSIN